MRFFAWVPLLLVLAPAEAKAACNQAGAGLGCFDANPGQGPADPGSFQWFGEGKVLEPKAGALTLNYRYVDAPLEVAVPSGMPEGRVAKVVAYTNRLELRAAAGIGRGLDVSIAVPAAVYQEGSGSESVSSQNPATIDTSGLGDVRLALRSELPAQGRHFNWTLRLEMTLPTGNERAYLGAIGPTEAVTTNLAFNYDRWVVVADLGARVAKPQRFADVIIGSHLLVGLGAAFHILSNESLTVALEGQLRPMLSSAPEQVSTDATGTQSRATTVIPAEWMASISSRPAKGSISFSLGAGTGLGLSRREVKPVSTLSNGPLEPRVEESFAAPTTPRITVAASLTKRF
jgi:hypothetical protein